MLKTILFAVVSLGIMSFSTLRTQSSAVSDPTVQQDKLPLIFSNFFSPNGDGKNDTFAIENLDEYPDNSIVIFNRWGEKVYEAAPYAGDWDGTCNTGGIVNDKLTEGVYFYVFKDNEADRTYNGKVTLKR